MQLCYARRMRWALVVIAAAGCVEFPDVEYDTTPRPGQEAALNAAAIFLGDRFGFELYDVEWPEVRWVSQLDCDTWSGPGFWSSSGACVPGSSVTTWRGREAVYVAVRDDLPQTLSHELIHVAQLRLLGDGDPGHRRGEWWSENGSMAEKMMAAGLR